MEYLYKGDKVDTIENTIWNTILRTEDSNIEYRICNSNRGKEGL